MVGTRNSLKVSLFLGHLECESHEEITILRNTGNTKVITYTKLFSAELICEM